MIYKLTFSDRPDMEVEAPDMESALHEINRETLLACEAFDPSTGESLGGISLAGGELRDPDEISDAVDQLVRELRALSKNSNPAYIRGKLAALQWVMGSDWEDRVRRLLTA